MRQSSSKIQTCLSQSIFMMSCGSSFCGILNSNNLKIPHSLNRNPKIISFLQCIEFTMYKTACSLTESAGQIPDVNLVRMTAFLATKITDKL